jgi:hypothetical protein
LNTLQQQIVRVHSYLISAARRWVGTHSAQFCVVTGSVESALASINPLAGNRRSRQFLLRPSLATRL